MSGMPDKQALRQRALAARMQLAASERSQYSRQIIDRLLEMLSAHLPGTENLLAYRSLASEVDTESLFHLPEYDLFAPRTHHHEHMEFHQVTPLTHWRKGLFGIMEPASGRIWDGKESTVLLAPLTAFDRNGNRLGMGKGCFDFWLAGNRSNIASIIGLAFSCQEVAQIPAEAHDVPMDYVITEKEIITCLNQ